MRAAIVKNLNKIVLLLIALMLCGTQIAKHCIWSQPSDIELADHRHILGSYRIGWHDELHVKMTNGAEMVLPGGARSMTVTSMPSGHSAITQS